MAHRWLQGYLNEFCWRYSHRHDQPGDVPARSSSERPNPHNERLDRIGWGLRPRFQLCPKRSPEVIALILILGLYKAYYCDNKDQGCIENRRDDPATRDKAKGDYWWTKNDENSQDLLASLPVLLTYGKPIFLAGLVVCPVHGLTFCLLCRLRMPASLVLFDIELILRESLQVPLLQSPRWSTCPLHISQGRQFSGLTICMCMCTDHLTSNVTCLLLLGVPLLGWSSLRRLLLFRRLSWFFLLLLWSTCWRSSFHFFNFVSSRDGGCIRLLPARAVSPFRSCLLVLPDAVAGPLFAPRSDLGLALSFRRRLLVRRSFFGRSLFCFLLCISAGVC